MLCTRFIHGVTAAAVLSTVAITQCAASELDKVPTYKLSVPLNTPQAIQVDQFGRLYILDNGRHTVMRFDAKGQLERSWPSSVHETEYASGRD